MGKYVAMLRGIGPMNPNMRNDRLRGVLESLGFQNVQTVISSGNVLFETDSRDIPTLETGIERALPEQLGFTSTTIIRSEKELQDLVQRDPFEGREHTPQTYLNVTFLKHTSSSKVRMPEGEGYKIVAATEREICSIVDTTHGGHTPDIMLKLEQTFGKEITTRTWKTVLRILDKF